MKCISAIVRLPKRKGISFGLSQNEINKTIYYIIGIIIIVYIFVRDII